MFVYIKCLLTIDPPRIANLLSAGQHNLNYFVKKKRKIKCVKCVNFVGFSFLTLSTGLVLGVKVSPNGYIPCKSVQLFTRDTFLILS